MDVITVTEAARLTGVEPATIRHWLRRGWIDGARKAGRVWLIPVEAVREFAPPRPGPKATDKEGHYCPGRDDDDSEH